MQVSVSLAHQGWEPPCEENNFKWVWGVVLGWMPLVHQATLSHPSSAEQEEENKMGKTLWAKVKAV